MRKKINTGLIATNGDGKPSVLPPIPAGWCRPGFIPSAENDLGLKVKTGNSNSHLNMSSEINGRTQLAHEVDSGRHQGDGTSAISNDAEVSTNNNNHLDNLNNDADDNSVEPCGESQNASSPGNDNNPQSLPNIINPNTAMSEDSNVDVETEEQSTPMISNDLEPGEMVSNEVVVSDSAGSLRHSHEEELAMSDAHYIEKQVVESFLSGGSSEITNNRLIQDRMPVDRMSISEKRPAANGNNNYEKAMAASGSSSVVSNNALNSKATKSLDAISLTIASVAAGEGGPPEFLTRHPPDKLRDDRSFQQTSSANPNKNKKGRTEKNMSASARLPVISSLLAPSSSSSHSALPGIQHIASSGKTSCSPTTALPSVAHFLGPAKSPPLAYTPHHTGVDMYGTSLPSTNSENTEHFTGHQNAQYHQAATGGHITPNTPTSSSLSKSKNSRKPVTPAGLRLSMAASEELPDPLPMPQYSEKVLRAKQLGTVAFDRPTVLRETVQFFLQYKHYWSSHDYDRISNLVIELFPEFKDNNDTPGVPANKRIRTDLSMYARNFRRREVSQRKKEGSSTPSHSDNKQDSVSTPETPVKSFLHAPSPSSSSGGPSTVGNNPSDFCNELLTAASIIESQNTSAARNGDYSSQISHNHHKVKISEPGQDQSVVIHKQEVLEEEETGGGIVSNHHHRPQNEPMDDEEDDTPIHFVYDKDMASVSRDANTAWQMYSDQMVQAMAAENSRLDYGLSSEQAVKKDLGTCARNMRRRLPATKYRPTSSQKAWSNSQTGLESQVTDMTGQAATMLPGTTEYMKAILAAQNMNLSELGMTQRNLGELAMLAGIKQRIEQHPQDVTDLEKQYLAQYSSEEQRQALMASGAFGNDTAAMAALSAFYSQLSMDISGSGKRGLAPDYSSSSAHDSSTNLTSGELLEVPNKRQRRISQAEVEKRLREAELSHGGSHESSKSHGLSVGVSDKNLVKREPMSPPGGEGQKSSSSSRQPHQNALSMPVFPSTSLNSTHEQSYWDAQASANMALMGAASLAHSASHQTATQAHSQAEIHHLPGHDHSSNLASSEAPMNLTYHESEKHISHRQHLSSDSPLHDSLPDTAGLAAQVEVTTSSIKSHFPRRRASSSPRSSQQGDQNSSRDQVWFPHGAGFKKENQEIVCLPDPLPIPSYSQKIITAREDGSSMRHRSEIIRETARFFLGLKYWWSSADYTRISELVVQQFPDLKDDTTADGLTNYRRIQRDLSMCARNLRRSKKPRKMRELSTDPSNSLLDVPEAPRSVKKQSKSSKVSSMFSSNNDKKSKRPPGSSGKAKKVKQEVTAVLSEPSASSGLNEDMTAAAALLQQQFMQSSSSSYHPSAHLLPSSHLLPSLQTHPALHEQQMQAQLNSNLVQQQQHHHQHHHQEGHNISVEDAHSAQRLVKEENHDNMEQHISGIKSSSVAPIQRSATPPGDNQSNLAEMAKQMSKSNHGQGREVETSSAMGKEEHEKVVQPQAALNNSMKVYVDPDHGNDLQERFSTLWRKGKFFDASLGVANKKLHVHKLVLLAMSPYLQETFKNADPRSQLEVNLPSDTTYETAKAFLKYIYEGVLEVDTSSVRSLHKIATMLQMTKLAQYCQNFAQQLQEEAEQANAGSGDSEIPKISVNLGELAEMQAQRQRLMEAQALQRLGESNAISSADLHRSSSARYMSEDRAQLKSDYLQSEQNSSEQAAGNAHFLHQDLLAAQHRALVAASSSNQSASSSLLLSSSQDLATQQLIQAALARHQASSPPPSSAGSSSMYHQHQQQIVSQADSNAALLHRLTSPESAVTASAATSLDHHQQRLALAAYWQAHTLELMSRNQLTGLTSDPSNLTSASELAAIAAAAGATTSEDTRHLLQNLGHEVKLKSSSGSSRRHHSKESWSNQANETDNSHQATMLPETCLPADMARSHHIGNSEGNT